MQIKNGMLIEGRNRMKPTPEQAFIAIAQILDGKEYGQVTKSDLFEAMRRVRHIAKTMIGGDGKEVTA